MGVSRFSFLSALLWCCGFTLVGSLIRRRRLLKKAGPRALLSLHLLGAVRLVFSGGIPHYQCYSTCHGSESSCWGRSSALENFACASHGLDMRFSYCAHSIFPSVCKTAPQAVILSDVCNRNPSAESGCRETSSCTSGLIPYSYCSLRFWAAKTHHYSPSMRLLHR